MTRAKNAAVSEATARGEGADAAPRCFVYILGSRRGKDCRTYVGWTLDLERRLAQHNSGLARKRRAGANGGCSMPKAGRRAARR